MEFISFLGLFSTTFNVLIFSVLSFGLGWIVADKFIYPKWIKRKSKRSDLIMPLNQKMFTSASKQLLYADDFLPRLLEEHASVEPQEIRDKLQTINTALLRFAKELKSRNFSFDRSGSIPEHTDYIIDDDPFRLKVTAADNGFVAIVYYMGFDKPEAICRATFYNGKEQEDNQPLKVHYGYRDFHYATAHILDAVAAGYLKQFARTERFFAKYKAYNEKTEASESHQSPTPPATSFKPQEASSLPSHKQAKEIHEAFSAIKMLEDELIRQSAFLSQENTHRFNTILNDCQRLSDSYYSMHWVEQELEEKVLEGLQLAVEKLSEIQGAVYREKEMDVTRHLEVLRQR